jgi:hypothetical protein
MKEKAYAVDELVEMMCSACDSEQSHNVVSVTKQGKITEAACTTCDTVSKFARGTKTSVSAGGRSKAAEPYDRSRKYKKGQAMMHLKFGHGEVVTVIEPQKIDVLFGDQTRRLIHDQV